MLLKLKKLTPSATIPQYAHKSDAAFDFVATSCVYDPDLKTFTYHTGIACEIEPGYEMQLRARSSVYKTGLFLCNSVGTIDSGYRGEIMFKFYSINGVTPYIIGDRIGQGLINKLPEVTIVEVEELSESDRGEGGFGSTGV